MDYLMMEKGLCKRSVNYEAGCLRLQDVTREPENVQLLIA